MTIEELAQAATGQTTLLSILWITPPVLAALAMLGGRDPVGESPRRFLFSALVYLVSIPGVLASVLTGYILFFQEGDLLQLEVMVYFAPIISMIATLALISRTTPLSYVPGFGRIGGLMVMLGATFAAILIIQRTRIWVVFAGGLGSLLLLALGIYLLIRFGAAKLFGNRDDERVLK